MTPLTQIALNELWSCANCFQVGGLDEHGRCPGCGSDAVASLAWIYERKFEQESKAKAKAVTA